MQIEQVKIENYMCLKQVSINFGNLTVLVGKNGSGKTSMFDVRENETVRRHKLGDTLGLAPELTKQ